VSSVGGNGLGGALDFQALISFPLDAGFIIPSRDDASIGLWDPFNFESSLDQDLDILEDGIPDSPHPSHFDNDHLAIDTSLDYGEFLHEFSAGATADAQAAIAGTTDQSQPPLLAAIGSTEDSHGLLNQLENLASSATPILQPHSGATTRGCDDGGIAVSGF
jgi:transcriptional activator HAC1